MSTSSKHNHRFPGNAKSLSAFFVVFVPFVVHHLIRNLL